MLNLLSFHVLLFWVNALRIQMFEYSCFFADEQVGGSSDMVLGTSPNVDSIGAMLTCTGSGQR